MARTRAMRKQAANRRRDGVVGGLDSAPEKGHVCNFAAAGGECGRPLIEGFPLPDAGGENLRCSRHYQITPTPPEEPAYRHVLDLGSRTIPVLLALDEWSAEQTLELRVEPNTQGITLCTVEGEVIVEITFAENHMRRTSPTLTMTVPRPDGPAC